MGLTCPVEACNNWVITTLWHHFGFWIFSFLTILSNMKWKSKSLVIFLSTDLSNGFLEFLFFVFHFLISCDHNYSIFRHSIGDFNMGTYSVSHEYSLYIGLVIFLLNLTCWIKRDFIERPSTRFIANILVRCFWVHFFLNQSIYQWFTSWKVP
jgi:hypothetical protein